MSKLRRDLYAAALNRLKEIFFFFRSLVKRDTRKDTFEDTFASLWATSRIQAHYLLQNFCNEKDSARSLTIGTGMVKEGWVKKANCAKTLSALPDIHDTDL